MRNKVITAAIAVVAPMIVLAPHAAAQPSPEPPPGPGPIMPQLLYPDGGWGMMGLDDEMPDGPGIDVSGGDGLNDQSHEVQP